MTIAQARVIAAAVEAIPDRVGCDVIEAAEAKLVELAADHDPSDLAKLGRRILEVVDPDRFEDEEARRLADAEKHASERQRLRMRALGDGTTRITAVVPDATAARLGTYLHAFTNPRLADGAVRANATDQEDEKPAGFGARVTQPRRMAEAFTQLLETLDPTRLPIHGGDATHVMVTIPFEALKRDLGVATIDNATPGDGFDTITAAHARRLACTARIIPAVLGTHGEVLDVGRASRLFTKAQRRALALRDGTCRAEGCDIPGTWSEAHHLVPWAHGGVTDLDNAALLCSRHHHRAHDTAYDLTTLANGDLRFHRRT
ncbi:HNH endonuclease signature motif containing protein [Nocardioides daphniae]|uniref:HNH endonuclease n=1 Tax=Nocardioides daphniae TaxID=402297 RepID=A0A4P7U8X0_9ACTN|nr:HNH endonuclease signature motif containing protein [Nocardioides daphniae]QCC76530.1 HNH endonuclease [Nocardioides daphniae]